MALARIEEATSTELVYAAYERVEGEKATDGAGFLPWVLLFAFGGGGLAVYYSRIGYFPDIEWQQALSYLGALAIIGGWIVVLFSLLLFVPGFIWSEFLIFDPTILGVLCFVRNERPEMCFRTAGTYIVAPFLGIMTVCDLMLTQLQWPWAALGGVVATACSCIYLWTMLSEHVRQAHLFGTDRASRLVKYVIAFATTALLGVFSLVIIKSLLDYPPFSWMTLICPLLVALSNALVAMEFRFGKTRSILISAAAAVVLLVMGETGLHDPLTQARRATPTALSDKTEHATLFDTVWRRFGFCGRASSTLVIDASGCAMLRGQDLVVTDIDKNLCRISNVAVLSRLGADVFFRAQDKRVSLPKTHVVSWSIPADLEVACP